MKADAGGRERFSGFHFGMDDWGNWRLNFQPRMNTDGHGFFKPVGLASLKIAISKQIKLRSGATSAEYAAPMGLKFYFGFWFYKYAAPTALETWRSGVSAERRHFESD
jgi:hypothetical protein